MWDKYLNFANYLVTLAQTQPEHVEACYRSAISRAYYACFLRARAHVRNSNRTLTHYQAVITWFTNHPDIQMNKIGQMLDTMRSNRNQADYGDTIAGLERTAEHQLTLAFRTFAYMDTYQIPQ